MGKRPVLPKVSEMTRMIRLSTCFGFAFKFLEKGESNLLHFVLFF